MTDFNTFEKDRPEYVKIFNEKLYQAKNGRTPQQVYDEDLTHTERTFVDILGMKPGTQQTSNSNGLGTTPVASLDTDASYTSLSDQSGLGTGTLTQNSTTPVNSLQTNSLSNSSLSGLGTRAINSNNWSNPLLKKYATPTMQLTNGVQVASNGGVADYQYWDTPAPRDVMLDRTTTNLSSSEGMLPHLYSDSKGNPTIAGGLRVRTRSDLDQYPLYIAENLNNPNAELANSTLKDNLWDRMNRYTAENCGTRPAAAGQRCNIPVGERQRGIFGNVRMREGEAERFTKDFLQTDTLPTVERSLSNAGFQWDDFGPSGQELFLNGFFNEGKTPNSIRGGVNAINNNDWNTICNAYLNNDIQSDRRNHYLELCRREQEYQARKRQGF